MFKEHVVLEASLNLPQFNGHFKKYTKEYTINEEGVSNEKKETSI